MAFLAGQAGAMAVGSATKDGGLLNQVIKLIIILVVLALVVILIFAVFLVWDNWPAIAVWGTTGFVGWLNPFDSDEGDWSPKDIPGQIVEQTTGRYGLGIRKGIGAVFGLLAPLLAGGLPYMLPF